MRGRILESIDIARCLIMNGNNMASFPGHPVFLSNGVDKHGKVWERDQ